jgi:alpha-D-xyloside xylohydrolase
MRTLPLVVFAVVGLTACGGAAGKKGLDLKVSEQPLRLTLVQDGRTLVAQDAGARFRYQLASTGEQFRLTDVTSKAGGVYQVATSEQGRTATVAVTRRRGGFHVSLRLHPETNVLQVYDAFQVGKGEHFLGGGERGAAVDLRGQILPVKVSYHCSYAPVPFFMSSGGWGVRLASENIAGLALPGSKGGPGCQFGNEGTCSFPPLETRAEVCIKGARLEEDLYAGPLPKLLASYQRDTGPPRVPPPSQLELVKWRDFVSGPDQLFEDVTRLRAAGIPLGWVLLDNPWESCVGALTFDTARFPDPRGMIDRLHAQRVKLMLWVSPKVVCPNAYPPSALLGSGEQRVVDLRDPLVFENYRRRIRELAALGIDGVKGDRGDEVDLEPLGPAVQNEYPLLFARAVISSLPGDAAAIFRAATVGSQRVLPALWGGDQPGEWAGLQLAIRQGVNAAMSGFPTWGSDVGGYASPNVTAEVFTRWAQLGAVSPVMEVGGIGPNATPWVFGAETMAAFRDAAVLHYELFPYLYSILRRGEPVLRPLGFGYPQAAEAWRADLELLVGPDLLAAPVTGPGTSPSVYLPPGDWIDLYRGTREAGGRASTRETPLAQFPLYARAGAVIPFNLRTAAEPWWGVDELTHAGRAGWLATPGAKLDLRGQPRDVQIFVPAERRPAKVTIGGRAVAFTWNDGPLPGAVVRLHGPSVRGVVALA